MTVPSISEHVHAADWHEREAEDLFGLVFEGHPKLGEFVLHEEWPEGVNPMRNGFDASQPLTMREVDPQWQPATIVEAPGAFGMPIGPVFSDFAEVRALPARDRRRGRDRHRPALLLQVSRRREDRRRPSCRQGPAPRRAFLRQFGVLARPRLLPGDRNRSAGSRCRRGHARFAPSSQSSSDCAITRRRSPESAAPRLSRWRPARRR